MVSCSEGDFNSGWGQVSIPEQGFKFLSELLRLEANFEADKIEYLSAHEFTLEQLYGLFSDQVTQKLTLDSLHESLAEKFGFAKLIDAELVLRRYDADEDGCLTFWEFANLILPVNEELRQQMLERETVHEEVSKYGQD